MSEPNRHPRVLVVGQSLNRSSGGGITLSNLFEGWPADRLAAVIPGDQPVSRDVCRDFYAIGHDEEVWRWPLSMIPRAQTPPSGPPSDEPETVTEPPRAQLPESRGGDVPDGLLRRTFNSVVDALGIKDALRGLVPSARLTRWIDEFAPDVVYAQFSDLPSMRFTETLAGIVGTPLVVHFMDDWPATVYRSGLFGAVLRRRALASLQRLVDRADVALSISDAMAAEYEKRYGRSFTALHNPVELAGWDAAATAGADELPSAPEGFRIVYAGRVGTANERSLALTAQVVSELAESGSPARLHLFTHDADRPQVARMAALTGVHVDPGVEYRLVPALLAGADALLLPLDFDEGGAAFAQLSIPTKASEYLASGHPVLTFAPAASAVAAYARDGGWAELVDTPDPDALREAITRLVEDAALRERLVARARETAERNHDAGVVRETFRRALAGAAGGDAS